MVWRDLDSGGVTGVPALEEGSRHQEGCPASLLHQGLDLAPRPRPHEQTRGRGALRLGFRDLGM